VIANNNNLPDLPRGWVWTELGSIINIRNGYAFKSSDYKEKGVLLLRQANLGNGRVSLKKAVCLPPHYLEKYQDFIVRKGDVIIGMSGSIGKLCVYDLETPALQNQRTGLIELFEPDTRPFVRYYFSTLERLFSVKSKGVGVQNISAKDIKTCSMPIPPIAEQKRIVAKIEELFTKLDAGVEALKKIRQQLKRYRQAVLKHAFEGKLTEKWRQAHKGELEPASKLLERIKKERQKQNKGKRQKKLPPLDKSNLPELPEGWVWTRLGQICDEVIKVDPKENPNAEFIYLDIASIDNVINRITSPKKYLGKKAPSRARQLVKAGDILFSTVRTYLKNIAVVDEKFDGQIASTGFGVIRPNRIIKSKLIFFLSLCDFFVNPLSKIQRGTSYPAVRDSDVFEQIVPIIPVQEQQQLVSEIERHFSIADQIEQTIEQGLKQAERLRQSILKRAFEGKLVEQNPEDEPASKLLEQIKVEKAILQAEKKVKKNKRRKSRKAK